MDNSDMTLNDADTSSSEQEFLSDALGGFESSRGNNQRFQTRNHHTNYTPNKNYHTSWWSYLISLSLTLLVVIALYYLNTDTATEEYKTKYKILTAIILLLAVFHVLIAAY